MPVNCVIRGCKSNGYRSKSGKENKPNISFHRQVFIILTNQLSSEINCSCCHTGNMARILYNKLKHLYFG